MGFSSFIFQYTKCKILSSNIRDVLIGTLRLGRLNLALKPLDTFSDEFLESLEYLGGVRCAKMVLLLV